MHYLNFFFGSGRRIVITSLVLLAVVAAFQPEIAFLIIDRFMLSMGMVLERIVTGVAPLITPVITIALLYLIVRWMWRQPFGGGRRR